MCWRFWSSSWNKKFPFFSVNNCLQISRQNINWCPHFAIKDHNIYYYFLNVLILLQCEKRVGLDDPLRWVNREQIVMHIFDSLAPFLGHTDLILTLHISGITQLWRQIGMKADARCVSMLHIKINLTSQFSYTYLIYKGPLIGLYDPQMGQVSHECASLFGRGWLI
jgi:hypothetical protein